MQIILEIASGIWVAVVVDDINKSLNSFHFYYFNFTP